MNAANTAAASRSTATKSAPSASSRSISNTRETRNISSGASHNNAAAATRSVGTSTRSSNSSATRSVTNDAAKRNDNATRSVSASTRSVNAAAANRNGNAGRSVASTADRHDNVASKAGTRTEARVHEGGRAEAPRVNNNPPAARNEPPRDNGRMNNNPPRPHDNGPMVHHEPPRPPRGPGHNPPPPPRPRPPRGSHFRASMIGTLITIAKINALNDAIRRAERAARLATRYSIVVNRNYTPRTYATIVETVRDDINYYYNDGVFYIIGADGDYYVIEPPIGALVEAIPTDYETVIIDDEVFYQVDDTLYRLTIIDGIPYFEVVLNL
ncbi:MAG: hypothetical protein J6U34_06270 [Bacteroidales bacterium]|nr:hypothetical protein [Bacteroidales bacterium]